MGTLDRGDVAEPGYRGASVPGTAVPDHTGPADVVPDDAAPDRAVPDTDVPEDADGGSAPALIAEPGQRVVPLDEVVHGHASGLRRPERRDAARNREALLDAAQRLVETCGVDAVTTDAVAAAAGVGKGTVFRRFGSRAGLMAALLDHSESRWQQSVISGPPPLGPGAEPFDRLVAFGASRLDRNLLHGDLVMAAVGRYGRSLPAAAFHTAHVRHLLAEAGTEGDLTVLAVALLAPLEVPILLQQLDAGIGRDRIVAGWSDLARRVVAGPG
jgi:AcrR family transcriptional regulator